MVKKVFTMIAAIGGLTFLFAALPTLSLGQPIGWAELVWDVVIASAIVISWGLYVHVRYSGYTNDVYGQSRKVHQRTVDERGHIQN